MQYDFVDELTEIASFDGLETKENMHLYQTHQPQDSFLKSTISNSNMITTSDIWQTSSSNSNTINQSFYFPSSFDFNNTSNPNQYHTMDNNNYDYNSLPDVSSSSASTYLMDPYSHMFTNNYPIDPYSTQTSYNSTSMDYTSSTYLSTTTDSYQHLHPMYTNTNGMTIPPASSYLSSSSSSCIDIQPDYQSTMSQWDSTMIKMRTHDDPRIEIKHSCEVPLPNITKLNRKDCRACRKAKCDRVGMTAMPKDRAPRTTTTKTTTYKTPTIPITDLLEQLARDFTYDQLSTSSALESLLRIIDLPPILPININYHTIYMNAVRIWRNQYNHPLQIIANASLMDTFPVLLFLFHTFITMTENDEDKSTNNSKFNKLVNILQQEIHRITGTDHRSASRIKALFMKCYVALAQYPNSTNLLDDNNSISQSQFLSYQPYPVYGQ
ncbi:unnamed protein product [Adineta steineri]|uniref:Nuclear receptor domain-containing protein n=1 Tax=Adineta steineri TaxID=433720 RepID=A0A818YSI0_9BILA|nr:unnamed protein product [Adineta steineri]CAF3758776.1 unnamed protein product [Adineta steineri]